MQLAAVPIVKNHHPCGEYRPQVKPIDIPLVADPCPNCQFISGKSTKHQIPALNHIAGCIGYQLADHRVE